MIKSSPSQPTPAPPCGTGPAAGGATPLELAAPLIPDPYLHLGPDRVYNPLTDRTLAAGERGYPELASVLEGLTGAQELEGALRDHLIDAGWLVRDDGSLDERFLLKYVSLEAHTVCNQKCYFCPVAIAPRSSYFMPTEFFEEIVDQLAAFRATIDGVTLINYNEPTLDKRFLDQVRTIKEAGLPPAVLTNGSGLTPKRIDAIVEMGGLRYLSINLSTLDEERYAAERGGNHLKTVLRNVDHAKDLPVADQMEIVVLGTGDENHQRDEEEIRQRFAGSRFEIKSYEVMDRAGYLQVGLKPPEPVQNLCGCEVVGSRPLQHIHITPEGKCVLCSEDYDHNYVVGDLNRQTVPEVLTSPAMQLMRRWVYGREEAPDDFICRKCTFALSR